MIEFYADTFNGVVIAWLTLSAIALIVGIFSLIVLIVFVVRNRVALKNSQNEEKDGLIDTKNRLGFITTWGIVCALCFAGVGMTRDTHNYNGLEQWLEDNHVKYYYEDEYHQYYAKTRIKQMCGAQTELSFVSVFDAETGKPQKIKITHPEKNVCRVEIQKT